MCITVMTFCVPSVTCKAREGINGTAAGQPLAAQLYVDMMLQHPVFGAVMDVTDFKSSTTDRYGVL